MTNFSNAFSFFIIINLVIVLYKIFICDRENKVADIVYSTKLARSKSVQARISIANMISLILYSAFYLINFLIHMFLYGFDGAKVSIQSLAIYVNSQYTFNLGQLAIIMFIEGMLATCAISMIVCLCSCYGKNTFSVLLGSLLFILVPILFDFSDIAPSFQKMLELLPIYSLNVISQYQAAGLFHNSILTPILSGGISIGIILISVFLIKQYFRNYTLKK